MGAAMGGVPGFGNQAMAGGRPQRRNAFVLGILPWILVIVLNVVFSVLASALEVAAIALVGNLIVLGIEVWWLINLFRGLNEMRTMSRNPTFPRWPVFIPFYNLYYFLIMVPQEMTKAKQMNGCQVPARNLVLYFLFPVFALQSDLNDLAG